MEGEKQLVEKYKQHHYNRTRRNIIKTVVIMGAASCLVGGAAVALTQPSALSIASYALGFLCVSVAGYLYFYRNISRNVLTLTAVSYFCFIYVPFDWMTYGGVMGSTPYISLAIIVIVILVLSRKLQKIILTMYLAVLGLLTAHSLAEAVNSGQDISPYALTSASYLIAALMIAYSLLFLLHKYESMYEHFLDSSVKDKLTGVYNRHVLDEVMALGEAQYMSNKADYAVVMLDIDKFKALNDEFGHAAGDVVLQNFADCVRESVRTTDYVLRYGGDEFLLMLPGATNNNVKMIYERIEKAITDNPFLQTEFEVTFSRGLAHRSQCDDKEQLIATADKRMYEYKQAG